MRDGFKCNVQIIDYSWQVSRSEAEPQYFYNILHITCALNALNEALFTATIPWQTTGKNVKICCEERAWKIHCNCKSISLSVLYGYSIPAVSEVQRLLKKQRFRFSFLSRSLDFAAF